MPPRLGRVNRGRAGMLLMGALASLAVLRDMTDAVERRRAQFEDDED